MSASDFIWSLFFLLFLVVLEEFETFLDSKVVLDFFECSLIIDYW